MEQVLEKIKENVARVMIGKERVTELLLTGLVAGGHILLEDIPGVGKTTLAMTIAKAMALTYRRVQFTPDVLPSDIVGFSMYNTQTKEFEYREGAVFANLFLADEINRTSPKTQSALLEAMEEEKVTVDGVEHRLPVPFTVIATENPVGSSGTQLLPESQLDRFMVCLSMGYPAHDDAVNILKNDGSRPLLNLQEIMTAEEWQTLKERAEACYVSDEMYDYVVRLTEQTRKNVYVLLGASPRASIALLRMAKAMAVMRGRDYVVPEDVRDVYYDVFGHRVKLGTKAKAEGMTVTGVLMQVFDGVKVVKP